MTYRATSTYELDVALDKIRNMPSELGHETSIANSTYHSIYHSPISIYVQSTGNSFQISESAGLSTSPVGEGTVNAYQDGSELMIRFSFGFLPKHFYSAVAAIVLFSSVFLFMLVGRAPASIGAMFSLVFFTQYIQQVRSCNRLLENFSRYFGEELDWKQI